MIRSLLWKEWREYRGFLLICAISIAIFLLCGSFLSSEGAFWIVCWVFPVVLMAQVVAGEYAGGTEGFFETLPVRRAVVSFVHLCFGLGILLVPFVAGSIIFLLFFRKVYSLSWAEYVYAGRSIQSVLLISLWIVAVAGRSRSRGFVAVIGAGVLFLTWCLTLLASIYRFSFPPWSDLISILVPFPPREISITIELLRILVMLALFHVAWWNLSHVKRTSSHSKKVLTLHTFNAPPRTSIWRMLLWKTFRDVWALALVSLVIDLGMAFLLSVLLLSLDHPGTALSDQWREFTRFSSMAGMMEWGIIGGILAIAIAMRLVLSEVSKNPDDFWRSRPIQPLAYFYSKYFIGAFFALLPFCFLIAVNSFTADTEYGSVIKNYLPLLVAVALLHVTLFSATICLCVFLRNGIMVVILASSLLLFSVPLALVGFALKPDFAAIWYLFIILIVLGLVVAAAMKWSRGQSLRRQLVADGAY